MKRLAQLALLACASVSSPAVANEMDPALLPTASPRSPRVARERDRDRLGWAVPDFLRVNTGGFAGVLGIGAGYAAFDDVLNVAVSYGFVPAALAGQSVHSISALVSVRPVDLALERFRVVPAYFGLGLLFSVGAGDYFVRVPERYRHIDERYYEPTGLHSTAHIGVELDWLPPARHFFERHGVYVELSVFDRFLLAYLKNPGIVNVTDIVSTGFGYRAAF